MTDSKKVADSMLAAIIKRWPIVLLVGGAVFCGLTIAVLHLTPLYTAQMTMVLPAAPMVDLAERSQQPAPVQTDPFVIRSYADVVKDEAIDRRVIAELHLANVPEFQKRDGTLQRILGSVRAWLGIRPAPVAWTAQQIADNQALTIYRKRLNVLNDGRSLTIQLSFQSADPVLAARIANAHANAYIDSQIAFRARNAVLKTEWLRKQLEIVAAELRTAEVALQTHVLSTSPEVLVAANQSADLKSRQAVATAKKNVYEALLSRLAIMAAEEKYAAPDTRIVSFAMTPTVASFPNIPIFAVIAALLSLAAGAGAALLAAFLKNEKTEASEVADGLGIKLVGTLHVPSRPLLTMPRSRRLRAAHFWEQVRRIRCALAQRGNPSFVTAVTSLLPDEGKSLVAASLARTFASTGVRTLLVDLDLRRPNAHKLLCVTRNENVGLGEALRKRVKTSDATVVADESSKLFLLSGASLGVHDIDVLGSSRLRILLDRLRREFKVIIIDTPPLGVVSDALNAAALSDHTLLVAAHSASLSHNAARAMQILGSCAIPVSGLIVTIREQASASTYSYLRRYRGVDKMVDVSPLPRRWRFGATKLRPLWEHSTP